MSVVLWALGAVTVVAGLVLAALGFSIHDRTYDNDFLAPATVAVVGGLVLVGIGLAVEQLRRIERALFAGMVTRPAELSAVPALESAVRLPLPPKLEDGPPSAEAITTGEVPPPIPAEVRLKFPIVAGNDVSPPAPAGRIGEDGGEGREAAAIGYGGNGATPLRTPRFEAKPRVAVAPAAASGTSFNAIWPPRTEARSASAHAAAPVAPPPIPRVAVAEGAHEPRGEAAEPKADASIAILKSGVVEGMAYTLYSDGSIEAQLPQGTVRFGSISALRHHLENSA
jgi:hypothetical protein